MLTSEQDVSEFNTLIESFKLKYRLAEPSTRRVSEKQLHKMAIAEVCDQITLADLSTEDITQARDLRYRMHRIYNIKEQLKRRNFRREAEWMQTLNEDQRQQVNNFISKEIFTIYPLIKKPSIWSQMFGKLEDPLIRARKCITFRVIWDEVNQVFLILLDGK